MVGSEASGRWALGWQEGRDPLPALPRQWREAGNEHGSRKDDRGGGAGREGAASGMGVLGLPLMPTPPLRPVQMQGQVGRITLQQAPDLGNTVADQSPCFVVAVTLRATTRSAYASGASVMCRYQAGQRRTSSWSNPTSPSPPQTPPQSASVAQPQQRVRAAASSLPRRRGTTRTPLAGSVSDESAASAPCRERWDKASASTPTRSDVALDCPLQPTTGPTPTRDGT